MPTLELTYQELEMIGTCLDVAYDLDNIADTLNIPKSTVIDVMEDIYSKIEIPQRLPPGNR